MYIYIYIYMYTCTYMYMFIVHSMLHLRIKASVDYRRTAVGVPWRSSVQARLGGSDLYLKPPTSSSGSNMSLPWRAKGKDNVCIVWGLLLFPHALPLRLSSDKSYKLAATIPPHREDFFYRVVFLSGPGLQCLGFWS